MTDTSFGLTDRVKARLHSGRRIENLRQQAQTQQSEINDLQSAVNQMQTEIRLLSDVAAFDSRLRSGFPLPPDSLRVHVGTHASVANFLAQGVSSAGRVLEVFGTEPCAPILDWGCGSGRTLRWLYNFQHWREQYYGCDVDNDAIEWLSQNGIKNVAVCDDDPPLPYGDATFDGLFAFSVLTHIHPAKHRGWYEEIRRVLKPNGFAYLTTQGASIINNATISFPKEAKEQFRSEGYTYIQFEGHYKDASIVGEAYTRRTLAGLLKVEYYKPTGYQNMDAFLVRRID